MSGCGTCGRYHSDLGTIVAVEEIWSPARVERALDRLLRDAEDWPSLLDECPALSIEGNMVEQLVNRLDQMDQESAPWAM